MDLDRLSEFVLIAEKKSIKKAADELGIAPATLSSRLKVFESSLGTDLFARNNSGLSLTVEGQNFYTNVSPIVGKYQKLKNEIHMIQGYKSH
jgi:DNA-binding transcriptional LysR family regulator